MVLPVFLLLGAIAFVVLRRPGLGTNRVVRAVGRALRMIGVSLGAGILAGMASGLGARLLMRFIAMMNRSHYGDVTHHNAVTGVTTLEGTLNVVIEGAFVGVLGSIFYLVLRPWLPGRTAVKGLLYGLLLLVLFGNLVLDGDYEYFRYVPPAVSVSLFALLFPLYGIVLAALLQWWARDETAFTGWPLRVGRAVIGVGAVWGGLNLLEYLRLEYQFFV
jgi:hypothetical protein